MGVLLFSSNGKETEARLVRAINGIARRHPLEVFHTIETISQRFRKPKKDLELMVVFPGSREDLQSLLLVKELFFNIPLILILPDSEPETIKLGFKLLPRFVSFKDGSFRDVNMVVEKMLANVERRQANGTLSNV